MGAAELLGMRGLHLARLDVVETNPALHEWYRRQGYEGAGRRSFDTPAALDSVLFQKGDAG